MLQVLPEGRPLRARWRPRGALQLLRAHRPQHPYLPEETLAPLLACRTFPPPTIPAHVAGALGTGGRPAAHKDAVVGQVGHPPPLVADTPPQAGLHSCGVVTPVSSCSHSDLHRQPDAERARLHSDGPYLHRFHALSKAALAQSATAALNACMRRAKLAPDSSSPGSGRSKGRPGPSVMIVVAAPQGENTKACPDGEGPRSSNCVATTERSVLPTARRG